MEMHGQEGHRGTHTLCKWFTERNLKCIWQDIKGALQECIMCKQRTDKYRYTAPRDADKATTSNFIIQIDFTGP